MTIAKAHWLLVGGIWIDVKETMAVIDKYPGETIGTVPVASRETVNKEIPSEAIPGNSRLLAHRRFRTPQKTSQLLAKLQDENAQSSAGRRGDDRGDNKQQNGGAQAIMD